MKNYSLKSYETHESYAGESYKKYVEQKMNVLKRRANENEEVGYLFSPKLHRHGKKIQGTLAYAGNIVEQPTVSAGSTIKGSQSET